jgi:hypothetical protein
LPQKIAGHFAAVQLSLLSSLHPRMIFRAFPSSFAATAIDFSDSFEVRDGLTMVFLADKFVAEMDREGVAFFGRKAFSAGCFAVTPSRLGVFEAA